MRYFIIAGEASGDLHGSYLVKYLKQLDSNSTINAWGGNKMQEAGAFILKHINDLAFMGFVEVVQNIFTIFKNFKLCKKQILEFKPDVIVFVDYPGFNLRIAKWAKENNFKTAYYISPQIWAWKENRIHHIKKYIDKMLCILPFEKEFYAKHHYEVSYVGHPLTHIVEESLQTPSDLIFNKPVIALIPGSRLQEVKQKLPIMLSTLRNFEDYEFVIAQSPTLEKSIYDSIIGEKKVQLIQNKTYEILKIAKLALVTSGTATLETALFNVPQIVCYKGNSISVWLARQLIKLKFISLVNIIANKQIVKELIQEELNTQNLTTEMKAILQGKNIEIKNGYTEIKDILGNTNAALNAAKEITQMI